MMDSVINPAPVKEPSEHSSWEHTSVKLLFEQEQTLLWVMKGIVQQQTASLQRSLQDAERTAYHLRSALRYEEAFNSLLCGTLAQHGIDEPFPPERQYPGTP